MNIIFLIRPLVVTVILFPAWYHYNSKINAYCYNLTLIVNKDIHTKRLRATQLQRTYIAVTYYHRQLTQIDKHIYTTNVKTEIKYLPLAFRANVMVAFFAPRLFVHKLSHHRDI